jgi:hypothetical protein
MRPRASIFAGKDSLIFVIAIYIQRMLFSLFANQFCAFLGQGIYTNHAYRVVEM